MAPEIYFSNLGIKIQKINRVAFEIFGIKIYWYGIIIVFSVLLGYFLLSRRLKKQDESIDQYFNFIILCFVTSLIGARLYYVAFSFDYYKDNLMDIFNTRNGGMAIYGAVIAAIITALAYCKINKKSFFKIADLFMPYLLLGQAFGRWGNFINKEAFGSHSNGFFAMAMKKSSMRYIPDSLKGFEEIIFGTEYIKVQPTFLYESVCSFILFGFLIWYRNKKQKFNGEIFCIYIFGYSLYRLIIEAFRTDQLRFINIPISQIVAVIFMITSVIIYFTLYMKSNKGDCKNKEV